MQTRLALEGECVEVLPRLCFAVSGLPFVRSTGVGCSCKVAFESVQQPPLLRLSPAWLTACKSSLFKIYSLKVSFFILAGTIINFLFTFSVRHWPGWLARTASGTPNLPSADNGSDSTACQSFSAGPVALSSRWSLICKQNP